MGVHKPTSRSIPAPVERTCVIALSNWGAPCKPTIPRLTNVMPATNRISRRPTPGQPLMNVENKRGKRPTRFEVTRPHAHLKAQKESLQ